MENMDLSDKSFAFQWGYGAALAIAKSDALKKANKGIWKVSGVYNGRRISKVCHNWRGAECALNILERHGCSYLTYERIGE